MSNFVLAADPVRPWNTLLSGSNQFGLGGSDDRGLVLNGSVSGLPATIELYGSNFGARGANLLSGAAQVNVVQYTVNGQVVMRVDNALITGPQLAAWLRGDGNAFEQAVFVGDDFIVLSNTAEFQNGYGGNDAMHGRGGNDTLLGGGGADTLHGDDGNDRLEGDTQDDVITGGWGSDSVHGGAGADMLYGEGGGDSLLGADGNDTLHGADGSDTLEGGAGDDLIIGGWEVDYAYGDAGMDTFLTSALKGQAQLTFTPTWLNVRGPEGFDYLVAFERVAFLDGTLHLDPADAAGQVWRLYGAAFGRGAETTGLTNWVAALDASATTLTGVANQFLGSAEFGQRYGQLDDAGFVTRLYANVLGRAPDAAGLDAWTAQLARGASRAEVLLGFSESVEYKAATIASTGRLWTVDPEAMDALRAYATILDRLPDAGGLANWTAARNGGLANADMVDAFIRSPEFQSRFGALSNEDFVARMYLAALDRPAEASGLAAWISALDNGALSRRDVVQGFAYSEEMTQKLLPLVSDGIAFA